MTEREQLVVDASVALLKLIPTDASKAEYSRELVAQDVTEAFGMVHDYLFGIGEELVIEDEIELLKAIGERVNVDVSDIT